MPQFAAGTCYRTNWNFRPEFAYPAVNHALDAGITHFDTALVYRSQKPLGFVLGTAFASSSIRRDNVFITTKVFHPQVPGVVFEDDALAIDTKTPHDITKDVTKHVQRCLHELNVGFVDLLLLHWPADFKNESNTSTSRARRIAAWKVLESTLENGWARAIGVSNFSEEHLEQLRDDGASIVPMVNQIETSVFVRHENIIQYCTENGIVVQAYSPLGSNKDNEMLEHPELIRMAEQYGMNTGQIAMRYIVQRNFALVALSTSPQRLKSNLDIFNFVLRDEDMKILDDLNQNKSMLGLISPYELN